VERRKQTLRQKVTAGDVLDDVAKRVWDRLNAMIQSIHQGDIILVKNTPTWGYYTLVKVVGNYDYNRTPSTPSEDYGHVLPVTTLAVVNKLSAPVAGDLRTSIDRASWPITFAIKRRDEILKLLDQNLTAEQLIKPVKWQERMDAQSSKLVDFVKDNVVKLSPGEFEELVRVLLESLEFENIKITAGPVENGADLVMSVTAPFFDDLPIVVQIKHHHPVEDDTTSVRKIFEPVPPLTIPELVAA
jgi:hypothetical protein